MKEVNRPVGRPVPSAAARPPRPTAALAAATAAPGVRVAVAMATARQIVRDGILARTLSKTQTLTPSPLSDQEQIERTKQIIRDRILASELSRE